ncbi:sigma-70 family RNA polymerase sigma factor [Nocardioides sp. LML1-1-1.1]|uniref:sigma-70 family RNA polymerase sigma factor n=1 Tax=Nocardioides sp. LML1-1-1.1 TaxID=3135248 RepID=UPI003439B04A
MQVSAERSSEESTESVLPSVTPSEDTFEDLYVEHVDDARRLATILVGPQQAEELVAESFARVLAQLRAGRGPRDNFRAYLHVTIRNGFRDSLRGPREAPVSDQPWIFDDAQPPAEELVEDLEADTAAHAFATLPESWQKVLWHVEVEGRKPGEVADLLGMRAGAVSSLAHRAREGLRRAYLDQHVIASSAPADCRWTRDRLSQYVRTDLSTRAEEKVSAHLGSCEDCLAAYLQVERVNRKLAAWIFPVVLLGALPASGKGLAWLVGLTGAAGAGSGGAGGAGSSSGSGGGAAGGGLGAAATTVAAAAAAVAVAAGGVTWVVNARDTEPTAADAATSAAPATDAPASSAAPRPRAKADPSVPRLTDPAPVTRASDPPSYAEGTDSPDPTDESVPAGPGAPATGESPEPATPKQPSPVPVVAVAPSAHPITSCETYGSLDLPTTRGVSYQRTGGDGRTGAWTVEASARPGYVLKSGTARTFRGDLGAYEQCVRLAAVNVGPPPALLQPWSVEIVPEVLGGPSRTITARVVFDVGGIVLDANQVSGAGWSCTSSTSIVCTFDYTGTAPPPVTVRVQSLLAPGGTVSLLAGDTPAGSQRFQG